MSEHLLRPSAVELPPRKPGDPRVGHLLGAGRASEARVVCVGFPSDEGVRRNGGRPGAAEGPVALRHALYRLPPDPEHHEAFVDLLAATRDIGDVATTGDVEADQERLAEVIAPHLARGAFVVVFGGGHETAFGHFLGHVRAEHTVEILNFDQHPDVREWEGLGAHSGSPFRQALLHPSGRCRRYTVAGLLPHATARAHLDFLEAHPTRWRWRRELEPGVARTLYDDLARPALATFCLDAVDAAHAPGVSAPAIGGLDVATWLEAAEGAGRSPSVASVDVCELCPPLDPDGRTARLAALTVWSVLRGLARRTPSPPRSGTD